MVKGVAYKTLQSAATKLPAQPVRHLKLVTETEDQKDISLVLAFRAGDEKAFTKLYERYQLRIINFINKMTGDRERSEDLTQETFLRVHRHILLFNPNKKFSSWIYTIASNLSKNELRNRSRSPIVCLNTFSEGDPDSRPIEFEDPKNKPDRLYERRRLRKLVNQVLSEMPWYHRGPFVLREIQNKNYQEISDILGVKLGTVKSRLNRARTMFARMIEHRI